MTYKTAPTPEMWAAAEKHYENVHGPHDLLEAFYAILDAAPQPTLAAPATDEILDEFIKEAEEQQEARISAWRRADDMTKLQQQAVRERDAANDRAAVALHAAADAYRQGAAAMREAAVKECEKIKIKARENFEDGYNRACEYCEAAIQSLPLEPPK